MREGSKRQTTPLFEQFTNLLSYMRIQVVYDEDDEDEKERHQVSQVGTHDFDEPGPSYHQLAGAQGQNTSRPPRRASFDNVQDSKQASIQDQVQATSPPHFRSRSQEGILRHGSRPMNARPLSTNQTNGHAVPPSRRPLLGNTDGLGSSEVRRKRTVQIREEPSIYEYEQSVASSEVSETDEDDSREPQKPSLPASTEAPDDDLDTKAGAFRFRTLAARAHRIFHDWQAKTGRSQIQIRQKSRQATQLDRNLLRKQALEKWRDQFLARRHDKDTDQFFEVLEKRAERARDLFLITKSFTHWAQYAADEILRTSAARRHIIRSRFFNAWREVTAVNELKVRRQGISKFFHTWRKHRSRLSTLNQQATQFRASHLSGSSYQGWFWEFCDRRAPLWHDTRVQERCWEHWSHLAHGYAIRDRWSASFARLQTLRRTWSLWTRRTQQRQQSAAEAQTFHHRSLIIQSLESWRRRLFFKDPVRYIAQIRASKLLRSTLHTWLAQARLSSVSNRTHDLRLMRNAWTSWNDRLRCQALARVIDERAVTQTLYKWILVERYALFRRISIETRKRRLFDRWRRQTQRTCSGVGRAQHHADAAHTVQGKREAFRLLRARAQACRQNEYRAAQLFRQKTLSRIVARWSDRSRGLRLSQDTSGEVHYILVATRTLKRWKEKLESRKKAHRREGYAEVRRRRKVELVRGIFSHWCGASARAVANNVEAKRLTEKRLRLTHLTMWYDQTLTMTAASNQGLGYRDGQLKRRIWYLVRTKQLELQELSAKADDQWFERRVVNGAIMSLKRLDDRLFDVLSHHDKATKYREKREGRHRDLMLYHWRSLAKQQRNQQSPPQSPSPPANPRSPTRGLAAPNDARLTATTPAYLQTPSRRTTGRLRGRLQQPPPGVGASAPSYVTPFMNRLRAQYPSGLPQPDRHVPGGQRGRRRDVEDIAESSPAREDGGG